MKKSFLFILVPMLCFLLAACTSEDGVTKAPLCVDVPTLEAEAIQEGTDTGKGQEQ